MREKTLKTLCIALVVLMISGMLLSLPILPAKAVTATLSILNPDDTHDLSHVNPTYWTAFKTFDTKHDGTPAGAGDIVFHTETVAGNIFYIRVYVKDIVNLWNWQIKVKFDPTVIEAAQAFVPATSIFNFAVKPTPVIDNTTGFVMMGASRLGGEPGVDGSDDLAWIVFEVMKGVAYGEYFSCSITFDAVDTYLLDPDMSNIAFTPEPGTYEIFWAPPSEIPYYQVVPAEIKAGYLGQIVTFNVYVKNVAAAWEIIGFQFALRFNATLLEPVDYTAGTFMEGFANDGEWVLYADGHDYIGDAALPPGYNAWTVAVMIMSDGSGLWHAPFPSGEGLLVSLNFRAIYETLSPLEAWTDVSFTELENYPYTDLDDFKNIALNQYMDEIPTGPNVGANYRAPMKILGLQLDLYSQYDTPFGGQDYGNPSDSFAPQAQVELYALVKYNDDPVQQKLVAFEIRHGEFYIYREATTNDIGIAHVSFRIPWPCDDPAGRVLGEWIAHATVEVAEQRANDTMPFKVWWHTEITSVEPKSTQFIKRKPLTNDPLEFIVTFRTYRMQKVPLNLTVVVYDELGFVIGYDILDYGMFGWGEYGYYCHFFEDTWEVTIPMPSNAMVGKAAVYANAFDNLPWDNGIAYCPEATNTIDFYIAIE